MGCVWMEHSIGVINIMIHDVYLSLQNVIIFFVLLMIYFPLTKRNSRYSLRTKYKYKFTLYTDGIHPKPLLAKQKFVA
jgi:hypothetical protein